MSTPKMFLDEPKFNGLQETLMACGRAVVMEIQRCVKSAIKPDGTPQKRNAPSTIKAKGHSHPVVEKRHRFEKSGTYVVMPLEANRVMITVKNPVDSEVAAHLEDQGYEFFGITEAAEEKAWKIMDAYLIKEMAESFGGKK